MARAWSEALLDVVMGLLMLLKSSSRESSHAVRRAKDSTDNQPHQSVRRAIAIRTLRVVVSQRRLRLVLVAFGLFRTAELATWVALLIWAYDVGGATAGGIIAVGQLLPATLAAPLGSVLMNRMPQARALRVGYLLQAATSLMVAGAIFTDAPFWFVTTTAAAAASSMTLSRPVHHALMPELAGSPEELTAGNVASTTLEGVGNFLGPALAGALLMFVSPPWVFVAMALTSLLAWFLVRNVEIAQNLTRTRRSSSYWGDAVEGLQAVVKQPSAAALTATVMGLFVVVGILDILAVVLALDVIGTGPVGPGLINSGMGIGALVGAGAAVTMVGRQHLAPAVAVGLTIIGVALALAGLAPNLLAATALFVLAGVGRATVDIAARTLLQRSVAPHVLARIFGMQEALSMAGMAIGAALAPLLVLWTGPRGAFVATAALLTAVGLATWPPISRLDRTGPSPLRIGRTHESGVHDLASRVRSEHARQQSAASFSTALLEQFDAVPPASRPWERRDWGPSDDPATNLAGTLFATGIEGNRREHVAPMPSVIIGPPATMAADGMRSTPERRLAAAPSSSPDTRADPPSRRGGPRPQDVPRRCVRG